MGWGGGVGGQSAWSDWYIPQPRPHVNRVWCGCMDPGGGGGGQACMGGWGARARGLSRAASPPPCPPRPATKRHQTHLDDVKVVARVALPHHHSPWGEETLFERAQQPQALLARQRRQDGHCMGGLSGWVGGWGRGWGACEPSCCSQPSAHTPTHPHDQPTHTHTPPHAATHPS